MKIVCSPKCSQYNFPGHAESPARVLNSYQLLKNKNYEFIEPTPATIADVLLVHDQSLINNIQQNEFLDGDTPNAPGMLEHALLSAGGAIKAMELALWNSQTFSLMRPPGHHATRTIAQGFCYFNNIAIAATKALKIVNKVAIVDIDCHHGNGTEEIFLGNAKVLYVSLHQNPCYPGTGLTSQQNCLNYPLPPLTQEKEYLLALADALSQVIKFKPQLLAISAGFDTYKNDPVTEFGLEIESYAKIGTMLAALHVPIFSILEGGYSTVLPQCIEQYLIGIQL